MLTPMLCAHSWIAWHALCLSVAHQTAALSALCAGATALASRYRAGVGPRVGLLAPRGALGPPTSVAGDLAAKSYQSHTWVGHMGLPMRYAQQCLKQTSKPHLHLVGQVTTGSHPHPYAHLLPLRSLRRGNMIAQKQCDQANMQTQQKFTAMSH